MTAYRLVSEPQVDIDIEAAFRWYENEQTGLGLEFLDELRAARSYRRRTLQVFTTPFEDATGTA